MENRYVLNILRSGLIDEIPLIIIGIDEKGSIVRWNKHAEKVLGLSFKDAFHLGIRAVLPVFSSANIPHPGAPEALKILGNIFSGKINLEDKETSILSAKGQVKYVKWSGSIAEGTGPAGEKALILSGLDQTELHGMKEVLTERSKYVKTVAKRLKKYARIDPLTGIFNYRWFVSELTRTFHSAMEKGGAVSLAILNVDYFNSVNSAYGNENGDRILKELAGLVKGFAGEKCLTARFGGNEIALLMPDTDIKTAFKISRGVFSAVCEHNFNFHGKGHSVNLSARMALGGYPHCEDARTPEQLIGRVLDKLGEARLMGSSSVLICSPDASFSTASISSENIMKGGYPYTVEFVNALARAVKTKDNYTQEHSSVMSEYAVCIAGRMGLNSAAIRNVRLGSILHDIGKIGIDQAILLKPAVLSEKEREAIKQHPRIGAEIIRSVHPLNGVVPIVLHHHERYDGNGYLEGLRGDAIPIGARIVSLADVFQALTSDRPYRRALPREDALAVIREYSGSFFDPKVVKAFFDVYSSRR